MGNTGGKVSTPFAPAEETPGRPSLTVLYDHQIFSSQPQGGISRYFAELLKGLGSQGVEPKKGWKYTANRYLLEDDPRARDWLPGVTFKGKAHLTGVFNRSISLRNLDASWDLFHPTYYDPYFLKKTKDRPFVITIHDMTHELYPEGLSDRHVVPARKRLLAEQAARIITVSENTRQDVINLLGIEASKIVVIPHGNSLRPGTTIPKQPAVSAGYWLYVGSRAAYKNWPVVVEALALRAHRQDQFIMVGGGPLSESEHKLLDQAGLSGRSLQTTATDAELAGWYAHAQALIYPSLYEGFGMPLLEAMAWGCPVVAAGASCLPEVGGEAILTFDPMSAVDLADQMRRLENPALRSSLVEKGRARERGFTWEKVVERTAAVYRECL